MLEILNAHAIPSLLILLLALLRACTDRKIPRKFFYILWTAAALRLIIPITVGLPLLPYEAVSEKTAFTSALAAGGTSREPTVYESSGFFGTTPENPFNESIFTLIYIVGAAAIALYFGIGHIKALNRCKISLPFQAETDDLKAALNLRRNVEIRTCENAVSPFTYGIFRPVIILPAGICEERLRHILGHELVHIKRIDVLQKLLFAIALCIHWTNPAVWLLYALAERDMEITCDEEAVKRLSFSPKSYALTLIDMEERLLPSVLTAFGKKPVRERIERLAQLGQNPSVMGAAAGFAAVIIAAAFFTAVGHMPPRVVYVTVTESADNIPVTGEGFAALEMSDSPEQPDGIVWEEAVSSVTFKGSGSADNAANDTVLYINEVTLVTVRGIAEETERYAIAYNEDRAAEALTYTIAVAENAAEDTTLCTALYKIFSADREEVCTASVAGSTEISIACAEE